MVLIWFHNRIYNKGLLVQKFFSNAKDSYIFSTKNNSVFVILPFEIFTNCYLTTSLILNNWPQELVLQSKTFFFTQKISSKEHLLLEKSFFVNL